MKPPASSERSTEDVIVHVAGAAITKAPDEPPRKTRKKPRALELSDRLDILEAERLVLTIEARNAQLRELTKLLPEAIRQAKPQPGRKLKNGRVTKGRTGSPGLLRLIARVVMRPTQIDRPPK